mgnify:CR=1 FL=1
MKLIIKCGKWIFEIKQIFARKTDDFGDDFTASLVINNSNGTAKIELMAGDVVISSENGEITWVDAKGYVFIANLV